MIGACNVQNEMEGRVSGLQRSRPDAIQDLHAGLRGR